MTPHTPQLQRNVLFRLINLVKRNPLRSLGAIPFLVILAGSLALQPAVGSSPVFKTIPVSKPLFGLVGILADPTRSVVYVADESNVRVAVIDTITNQIESFISTINPPVGLALSPDGSTLYVSEDELGVPFDCFLEAISLSTGTTLFNQLVDKNPAIPVAASDGSTVYVPCQTSGTVVPVGGPLLGASIHIGGSPIDVVFNHDNTFAYVTSLSKQIAVINTSTGAVHKFSTPTRTIGILRKGTTLYATGLGEIYVINIPSNTIVDTIKLPKPATGGKFASFLPALTPDGVFLYAPLTEAVNPIAAGHSVLVIDTRINRIQSEFKVGIEPIQVAAAANDLYGYCSNEGDGTVTVFDLAHPVP